MNSTQGVIANHIRRFREGNLEGVLDDLSPDALLFTPAGLLKGRGEIRKLIQKLLADFGKSGGSETVHTQTFEGRPCLPHLQWRNGRQ
jgi:hypothetical protein